MARRRAVTVSPFRSYQDSVREAAAFEMVDKRRAELAALKALSRHETRPEKQRRLALKILATSNNLKSWLAYLEDPYVEPRATVIPGKRQTNG